MSANSARAPMRPALRRGPPRTWRTAPTGSTSAPPIRPATSTRRRPRSASPSRPPASARWLHARGHGRERGRGQPGDYRSVRLDPACHRPPQWPYRGSGVHTGAGCTRTGDYIANCNATGIRLITVNAGDLMDRVTNSTDIKSSLVGGGGPDVLIGGSSNDNLSGLAGADVMRGMNGNDRLFGHDGSSDKTIDCDGGNSPGAADQADLDASPRIPIPGSSVVRR